MAGARSDILEFAVLGILDDGPLHGYELRKRLSGVLGAFRAISYGSLYPALKTLKGRGLISEFQPVTDADLEAAAAGPALSSKRARISYALTAAGKDRFAELVSDASPESWEDERFAARMAFFGRTEATVRMRILTGRRSRLEERVATLRESMARSRDRVDTYTQMLAEHGLEGAEREVAWLDSLIAKEVKK